MVLKSKKGLLPQKLIPPSFLYKEKTNDKSNFSVIIVNFTTNKAIRDLLFKFVNNISYKMSSKEFEKQLSLLKPLNCDTQIRIINNTIQRNWNSLVFEYNKIMNGK